MKYCWVINDYHGFIGTFDTLDDARAFLVRCREGCFSDVHKEGGLDTVDFTTKGASGRTHTIQRVRHG